MCRSEREREKQRVQKQVGNWCVEEGFSPLCIVDYFDEVNCFFCLVLWFLTVLMDFVNFHRHFLFVPEHLFFSNPDSLACSHVIISTSCCSSFFLQCYHDDRTFCFASSRGDFPLPRCSLVVSRWCQVSIRHHQRHPGAQDGAANVHRHTLPNGEGVSLP